MKKKVRDIAALLELKGKHLKLDIGCGASKQGPEWVGIDMQALPGVDIVHDIETYPWPVPDGAFEIAVASHIAEHINPAKFGFINWMNEIWRVMEIGGRLMMSMPYALSTGYVQDPTHCYAIGAETLTDSGFKPIHKVRKNERVLTRNWESGKAEWSPCVKTINEHYEGDMVRFKTKQMDLLVTPNHSMFCKTGSKWKLLEARNFVALASRGNRTSLNTVEWDGLSQTEYTLPNVPRPGNRSKKLPTTFSAELFAEFIGWYLAEGCCTFDPPRAYTISIAQSLTANPAKHNRILQLVKSMGFSPTVNSTNGQITFASKELCYYLKELGLQHERYVPVDIKQWDKRLLQIMLRSLTDGDGSANGPFCSRYHTVSKRLAADVQEIALKAGYKVGAWKPKPAGVEIIRGRECKTREAYDVSYTTNLSKLYFSHPVVEPYSGKIVCVNVKDNHVILVRNNGKITWCGNCNPCNENTWIYFDPMHPSGFYRFYRPSPWKIVQCYWSQEGFMEVVLEKRRVDRSYSK